MPAGSAPPPDRAEAAGCAPLAAEVAFPTPFPIKILGRRSRGFAERVLEIVRAHAPDLADDAVEMRVSREGAYLGVTVVVNARSREQLEALYRDLCDHPDVVTVL